MSLQIPRAPRAGESMKGLAALLSQLIACIKALEPRGGQGIRVSTGPGGTTIAADRNERPVSSWARATNVWACVPPYVSLAYYGPLSSLPQNVKVCNGQTCALPGGGSFTVPDLRGKYTRGLADGHVVGDSGGSQKHRHADAYLPSHRHTGPWHTHGMVSHDHVFNHTHTQSIVEVNNGDGEVKYLTCGGQISQAPTVTDIAGGGSTGGPDPDPNYTGYSGALTVSMVETDHLDPHSYCNYVMRIW